MKSVRRSDHALTPLTVCSETSLLDKKSHVAISFPDMYETVESMIAEDDQVAVRFRLRGTHTGEFYGIAPTGRGVDIYGIDIVRIVDDRIVGWVYQEDALALFSQLGSWPADLEGVAGIAT